MKIGLYPPNSKIQGKILYKNIKVETQNEENVVEAEKEFYESIAGE